MSARHRRRHPVPEPTTFSQIDVEGIVKAIDKFRDEHPEEYAAQVARNKIAWPACNYDHNPQVKFCSKCGWNE